MRKPGGCKLTSQEWKALQDTNISELPATEQQRRLEGTELWYQSGFTWATVAMAQVIRSRLSAKHSGATLYFIPAQDYVLNRPANSRLGNAYIAEQIARIQSMNTTARLPSIAMIHTGMIVRLTNTVESPEAVTDSTGVVVCIDVHPDDDARGVATEHVGTPPATRILRKYNWQSSLSWMMSELSSCRRARARSTAPREQSATAFAVTSGLAASP